jgi:hypothetical protein
MQVFLVKHRKLELYVANGRPPCLVTDKRDHAFRFGTSAQAETARRRTKIPLQWQVIACGWDTLQGQIATNPTDSPRIEDQP